MKHLITTAIVSLGLVAQSGMVSIDQQMNTGQAIAAVGSSPGDGSKQLSAEEAATLIGGNGTGCIAYLDENLDTRVLCCLDLWIFSICFGVNVSAIERFLPF